MATVVVVGSSPLLLVQAIERARSGDDVLVVEARSTIGGSWSVRAAGGWTDVEDACHLLERGTRGYDRLVAAGVRLEPMRPVPYAVLCGRRGVPYTSRRWHVLVALLAVRDTARALVVDRSWTSARTHLSHIARFARRFVAMGVVAPPVLYFTGGVASAQRSLLDALESAGGRLVTGRRVVAVEVGEGVSPRVVLDDGEEVVADRVLATDGVRGARIVAGGVEVPLAARDLDDQHVLLAVSAVARPISYVYSPFHRWLQRVTDVTASARRLPDAVGEHLLLVHLRRGAEVEVDAIVQLLVTWRLLADPSVVRGVWPLGTSTSRVDVDDAVRDRLRAIGLDLCRSHGDLIESLQ